MSEFTVLADQAAAMHAADQERLRRLTACNTGYLFVPAAPTLAMFERLCRALDAERKDVQSEQ